MRPRNLTLLAGLLLAVLAVGSAFGATTIISDNYNVSTTTTGFALDNGVNYGINPPTTRLTGTAAANLRYIQTATGRTASLYGIGSSKLRVQQEGTIGRFTLSANGSTPYSFASVLGTVAASPANPAVYDITIGMQNNATGTPRLHVEPPWLLAEDGTITRADVGIRGCAFDSNPAPPWGGGVCSGTGRLGESCLGAPCWTRTGS